MPNPLLIVTGLNGALVQRVRPMAAANISYVPPSVEQHSLGVQKIFVRPGARDGLLRLIAAGHTVGVWSGSTMRNTDPIIQSIFPDIKFAFVWSRDHTSPDAFRRQASLGDSGSDHATLKDVSLLWRYKVAGEGSNFGPRNTVIMDDDAGKSRRYADNYLWMPPYDVEDTAAAAVDESLGFNKTIDFLLRELTEAEDVRNILPHKLSLLPEPKR